MRVLTVVVAALWLVACGHNPTQKQALLPGTQCKDPRPQVCTMEYNPVCATRHTGATKQYASGCNACADDAVSHYLPGPCPVEE